MSTNPQHSSVDDELREKLRALPRTDHLDSRYPIYAYEDDLVALIEAEASRRCEALLDGLNDDLGLLYTAKKDKAMSDAVLEWVEAKRQALNGDKAA